MAGEGLGFQGHWQEWCGLAIASSPKGFKAEVTGGPSTSSLTMLFPVLTDSPITVLHVPHVYWGGALILAQPHLWALWNEPEISSPISGCLR